LGPLASRAFVHPEEPSLKLKALAFLFHESGIGLRRFLAQAGPVRDAVPRYPAGLADLPRFQGEPVAFLEVSHGVIEFADDVGPFLLIGALELGEADVSYEVDVPTHLTRGEPQSPGDLDLVFTVIEPAVDFRQAFSPIWISACHPFLPDMWSVEVGLPCPRWPTLACGAVKDGAVLRTRLARPPQSVYMSLYDLQLDRAPTRGNVELMDSPENTRRRLSINQVIAQNLRLARLHRGLTQAQAAERLQVLLGEKWSPANLSLAERSAERDRKRFFNADEIMAFCLVFELPLSWFFLPVPDAGGELPLIAPLKAADGNEPLPGVLLELLFGSDEGQALVAKRLHDLLEGHPELEGPFMKQLNVATGRASRAAIARSVGELGEWVTTLRTLATYLEEAKDQTGPEMNHALEQQVTDLYGELLAADDANPRTGRRAGPR